MAEPFRDEMTAALTRAEKLAEENRDLREELQRLRVTAHTVRAQSPDDALATQTLAVLDRLEDATHVDALAPVPPMEAEHADPATLVDTGPKRPFAPTIVPSSSPSLPRPPAPLARSTGIQARTFLVACAVCLAVGFLLGALAR